MWLCLSREVRFDAPYNSCLTCPFLNPTGPSSQTRIGPDRMVFKSNVTFSAGGSLEEPVCATIINDDIALEDNETFEVFLSIVSPQMDVTTGLVSTTMVTIVDNDGKSGIAM